MAFGISKWELEQWKQSVKRGHIAFLTHWWFHPRFPQYKTVTKVGCSDIKRLLEWAKSYGLKEEYLHWRRDYPHFDLLGEKQREVLYAENLWNHIERFAIRKEENFLLNIKKGAEA